MKYKHKPTVVEAVKMDGLFTVPTLEGTMIGQPGDYLVTGTKGEQYPVAAKIFEEIYEEVQ